MIMDCQPYLAPSLVSVTMVSSLPTRLASWFDPPLPLYHVTSQAGRGESKLMLFFHVRGQVHMRVTLHRTS